MVGTYWPKHKLAANDAWQVGLIALERNDVTNLMFLLKMSKT